MATLKGHQQAMVDLLASGSGIPASASRLAHAMHDVLAYLNLESAIHQAPLYGADATTPGLNDKALADDIKALQVNSPAKWPKVTRFDVDIKLSDMDEVKMTLQNMQSHLDGARDSQRAAERRVKELENTVKQLKGHNAKLRAERNALTDERDYYRSAYNETLPPATPEQAMQELVSLTEDMGLYGGAEQAGCLKDDNHADFRWRGGEGTVHKVSLARLPVQSGCRKDDTQVCERNPDGSPYSGVHGAPGANL